MYAPLQVGEAASGQGDQRRLADANDQPMVSEVMRIWAPPDGTPNVGYAARWIRDPRDDQLDHIATMLIPFTPTGVNGQRWV